MSEENRPIKPRLVAIDETEYWTMATWPQVEKIITHYLYDMNQVTYCCEITPSYWLQQVETFPVFKGDISDFDDSVWEERQRIYEDVDEIARMGDNGMYMHCSAADALPGRVLNAIAEDLEDDYDDRFMEWVHYAEGQSI